MIEYLIVGLLVVIAGAEVIRLYSLMQKRHKKNYFATRAEGVDREIWDTDFSRYKAKEIKENLRGEMTALKSKQEILRTKIKEHEEKKDLPEGEIARLRDEDEKLQVKIYKMIYGVGRPKLKEDGSVDEQETAKIQREVDMCLKGMDEQIGFLNEKIDSLHELKSMVQDYIKKEL